MGGEWGVSMTRYYRVEYDTVSCESNKGGSKATRKELLYCGYDRAYERAHNVRWQVWTKEQS